MNAQLRFGACWRGRKNTHHRNSGTCQGFCPQRAPSPSALPLKLVLQFLPVRPWRFLSCWPRQLRASEFEQVSLCVGPSRGASGTAAALAPSHSPHWFSQPHSWGLLCPALRPWLGSLGGCWDPSLLSGDVCRRQLPPDS